MESRLIFFKDQIHKIFLFTFLIIFLVMSEAPASAPRFEKVKIELSQNKIKKTLNVDLAETVEQHTYGLMNRTQLSANDGMLFVFPNEQFREFWMKDTLIDLDIAYIDKNLKIVDIQQMKAMSTVMKSDLPTYPSAKPAQYALEMNQGWFKINNFSVGTQIKILSRPKSKKK